jgi:hydroxypyruvate reductase
MNTDLNGQAVDDAQALFKAAVRRVQADRLIDATTPHEWAPRPLSRYDEVRVAGMGKAAMAMAGVINDRQPGLVDEGVIGVPTGYPGSYPERLPSPSTVQVMEGGHPLPTEDSERAGRRLLDHARALGEGDLLLVPVSGGGTALSTLSADALDLPALRSTYRRLMEAGVPIHPANAVRKHLTQVGGGQLAATAHPAHVSALVVSDVPGNDLSAIASGPTVPDPSTYADAIQVLYRHDLWSDVPDSIRNHLAEGAHGQRGETPKPDTPCFDTARTTLIGTNKTALQAARAAAQERGYEVRSLETAVEGEAREVGRAHARRLLEAAPDGPTCWLWGGETTVTVTGEGTGGRNQEVALGAARELAGSDRKIVILSGGTDGIDGPTDAAGAWATPETAGAAQACGFDPGAHLADNDAYPLLDALDQLLTPGPTHTNVMDVQIGLVRTAAGAA